MDGLTDGRDSRLSGILIVFHSPVPSSCEVCRGSLGAQLNSTAGKGVYNVLDLSQEHVMALTRGAQCLWTLLVIVYFG